MEAEFFILVRKNIYTYVKKKDKKQQLEQSETLYMSKLHKFCPTIPDIIQKPGNFCREYFAEQNAELILKPLPECIAKKDFEDLMELWRKIRSIQKKTELTEDEKDEYPNLVRRFFFRFWIENSPGLKLFPTNSIDCLTILTA